MKQESNLFSLKGEPLKGKPDRYHMRLCLVGLDDIDIKNIQTFGIADDGFFMVKSLDNPRLPVFMTNPVRVRSVEIYKDGDKPLTKLIINKDEDDLFIDLMRKASENTPKTK
jgi:hypothetical protein